MKIYLLAAGMAALAAGGDPMTVSKQNELVRNYCAVCHTDADRNGGLSLEHFDAAHPDPAVAAMTLSKLRTGAIGADGSKKPDEATIRAWISATAAQAAGANRWHLDRAANASLISASIVQELPSGSEVPDAYRLTVTCRADSLEGGMELAWSPGVPKNGQLMSSFVDGKELSEYKLDGTEKMGNGADLLSGPGSVVLYPTGTHSAALPGQTLTIRNVFPNQTVTFPFSELPPTDRRALSQCFSGKEKAPR